MVAGKAFHCHLPCRLAQLLVINSLVLKQQSPYIEYFYR
jgi:hypothetical protein